MLRRQLIPIRNKLITDYYKFAVQATRRYNRLMPADEVRSLAGISLCNYGEWYVKKCILDNKPYYDTYQFVSGFTRFFYYDYIDQTRTGAFRRDILPTGISTRTYQQSLVKYNEYVKSLFGDQPMRYYDFIRMTYPFNKPSEKLRITIWANMSNINNSSPLTPGLKNGDESFDVFSNSLEMEYVNDPTLDLDTSIDYSNMMRWARAHLNSTDVKFTFLHYGNDDLSIMEIANLNNVCFSMASRRIRRCLENLKQKFAENI